MNVELICKGYNLQFILLGQIDLLGGNIYEPNQDLVRVAFV